MVVITIYVKGMPHFKSIRIRPPLPPCLTLHNQRLLEFKEEWPVLSEEVGTRECAMDDNLGEGREGWPVAFSCQHFMCGH